MATTALVFMGYRQGGSPRLGAMAMNERGHPLEIRWQWRVRHACPHAGDCGIRADVSPLAFPGAVEAILLRVFAPHLVRRRYTNPWERAASGASERLGPHGRSVKHPPLPQAECTPSISTQSSRRQIAACRTMCGTCRP